MLDFITVNTHSSIRIADEKIIYIDPFKITDEPHDADIILITHDHFDHYSPEDILKIMRPDTVLVMPQKMKSSDATGLTPTQVSSSDSITVKGISIETIPAYNKLKPFHPKSKGWVGYIINSSEHGRIYIAGDTDITDENSQVRCRIAMLPAGGTYTMNAANAAKLANTIRPEYAIPVHYGSVAGSMKDGETFKAAVDSSIEVVLKLV